MYYIRQMTNGLIQLVAQGAQDAYLTENPQITFFKKIYRRHTNFALEAIEQTNLGTVAFGGKFSVEVARNGDLINRIMLEVDLPELSGATTANGYVDWVGHRLIEEVWVEIGGQQVDIKDYNFNWAMDQLREGDNLGYETMLGKTGSDHNAGSKRLYIPIRVWFSDDIGLALPLVALQYHQVKLTFRLASKDSLFDTSANSTANQPEVNCFIDYVYLDKDERLRFAQVAHEYLITQTQSSGKDGFSNCVHKARLNFNHPCKELIWLVREDCGGDPHKWTQYKTCKEAVLVLNNTDRFQKRGGEYFTLVQPWQHHSNVPESQNVHVYSFAINPEEHQPSGTCNMSRIENTVLHLTMNDADKDKDHVVFVYAVNYNVLRIMHGMGGIAYSN